MRGRGEGVGKRKAHEECADHPGGDEEDHDVAHDDEAGRDENPLVEFEDGDFAESAADGREDDICKVDLCVQKVKLE